MIILNMPRPALEYDAETTSLWDEEVDPGSSLQASV